MTATPRVILGSSSPWRQKVLRDARIPFEVVSPDIDEKSLRHDDPEKLTRMIAAAKMVAIAQRVPREERAVIITADQVAVFDGVIREKPENPAQARRWLLEYGLGRPVSFVSAVLVARIGEISDVRWRTHRVDIRFRPLTYKAVDAAIARGGVLASCGAVVVEDPDLAPYVATVQGEGSDLDIATSECGLPIGPTLELLARHGVHPTP